MFREATRRNEKRVSVQTLHRYRDSVSKFLSFCAERFRLQKMAKVTDKHLRAYVEWRRENGIAEKTIKEDLAAVRFFHRYTGSERRLAPNEAFGLRPTPQGGVDRAWTEGEFEKMTALAERLGRDDVAAAMGLARHAGLRIHECVRLNRADAEEALRTGVLTVLGKGGRIREIPLRPRAKEILRAACDRASERRKLFVSEGEKAHVVIKRIQAFIERHRETVTEKEREVNLTFHGLRHLYAREEYQERVRPVRGRRARRDAALRVAELLGHGRAEVTRIYIGKEK